MQKEYFWAPAVVLLLLFFAGGVYSQFEQSQSVQDSIQRGMDYLSVQPSYDGELFVLYLIQQKSSNAALSTNVSTTVSLTDDFHYPMKQFVSGQSIEENQLSEQILSDPYYPHFVSYFSCKLLTQEWIDSLYSLSDNESSSYRSSHALLFASLIRQDYFGGRCGDFSEFSKQLDELVLVKQQEVAAGLNNRDNFDSWVERVAVLAFSDFPIEPEVIDFIVSNQSENGGWAPMIFEEPFEEERSHTTALAVWALTEAST